ncbi:MAG: PfkB family carbohydrate kinase [Xanthomonadales bacterium]|nr:PfkB family carbohydrate kinase [Xanthomonadales bacterium]
MTARPCIFGEVLFDHFPDGRRVLGGAPFNVAWHLQAFGASPFMVSKVGEDEDATAVQTLMSDWGMDPGGLGVDASLPTGRVRVQFEQNEPTYDIVHPAAWDTIEIPARLPRFSLLYHGSLALRSKESRRSCEALREKAADDRASVFVDVNLREPWWNSSEVLHSLKGADWVKLNSEELDVLSPGSAERELRARTLLESFGLNGALLTHGSQGAVLLTAEGERWETRPESGIKVRDTVGAGDAMASVMILGLLHGWDLKRSLDRAQEFASAIVGLRGATVPESSFYRPFMRAWSLNAVQSEQ